MKPLQFKCSIDISATEATPAIAVMIGDILKLHGAKVRFTDKRCRAYKQPPSPFKLEGLTVTVDRLTWVRER